LKLFGAALEIYNLRFLASIMARLLFKAISANTLLVIYW
jgi:hypothetical protein